MSSQIKTPITLSCLEPYVSTFVPTQVSLSKELLPEGTPLEESKEGLAISFECLIGSGSPQPINIFKPEEHLKVLKDADDIVIRAKEIKISYPYPVNEPETINFTAPQSQDYFTRKQLAECIIDGYNSLCLDEDEMIDDSVLVSIYYDSKEKHWVPGTL